MYENRFAGKVAIVTGAAWGMGEGHATRFATEGASVVLVDIQDELVHKTASSVPNAMAVVADVTKSADVTRMVDEAVAQYGGIDILVNNAGGSIYPPSHFWDIPEEQYDFLMSLNMKSQWLCAKAVTPHMQARGGGRIINISSESVYMPNYDRLAYCTAKTAVLGQTRAMAHELGPYGITVNSITPGWIDVKHPKTAVTKEIIEQQAAAHLSAQSIKRMGTQEDVTAALTFLASDEAAFLTAQVLRVDGGKHPAY